MRKAWKKLVTLCVVAAMLVCDPAIVSASESISANNTETATVSEENAADEVCGGSESDNEEQKSANEVQLSEDTVSQDMREAAGIDTDITRAAWISSLVSVFSMSVDEANYPDNYYSDISSGDSYYADIMKAVEFGVINLEAGAPFEPDKPATREFAADTLNRCLGYQLETDTYTYSDVASVSENDRAAAQIAVSRNWIQLSDDRFMPDQPITAEESKAMLDDAQKVIKSQIIDEDHENTATFANGVVVVNKGTSISYNDASHIVIKDCPVKISAGQVFGIWYGDIPAAYKAVSVQENGSETVIETSTDGLTYENTFENIDAAGKTAGDLESFTPAEPTAVETADGSDAMLQVSDIEMSGSTGTIKLSEISMEKSYSDLPMTVTLSITNLSADYDVNNNRFYLALNGDYEMDGELSFKKEGEIELGEVSLEPFGIVTLAMKYDVNGRLSVIFSGNMTIGVDCTKDDDLRFVRSFRKNAFSITAEATVVSGFELSWDIDYFIFKGRVYADAGVWSYFSDAKYADGKLPLECSTVRRYMYFYVGASATLYWILDSRTYEKKQDIYNEDNSPVRVYLHVEDGAAVTECTRGEDKYYCGDSSRKYYYNTSRSSKYYTPYGSKYYDSSTSSNVCLFKYTTAADPNNGSKKVVTITGYNGSPTSLYIPDEIDGNAVVKINAKAFKDSKGLRQVSFPNSILEIDQYAFSGCTSLQSVILPAKLTAIQNDAFGGCTALKSVWIPKSLKTDTLNFGGSGGGPFSGCSSLTDVTFEDGVNEIINNLFDKCNGIRQITLPDTVTGIGAYAFRDCANLEKVVLSNSLTVIGVYAFANDSSLSEISFPDNIAEIDQYAFSKCTKLKNIVLPKRLSAINNDVFYQCTALESVWIPKSLKTDTINFGSSGGGPFSGCSSLNNVTFEDGINNIVDCLFMKCDGIKTLTLPATVSSIGKRAFESCSNLTEVVFPDALTSIDIGAFDSAGLKSVTLPAAVKTVGNKAFNNCTALTGFVWKNTGTSMGTYVLCGCTSLKEVVLPEDLQMINDGTVNGCTSLESISLPSKISNINKDAFNGCTSLKAVTIPADVTKIGENAFYNDDALTEITIPDKVTQIDSKAFYDCDALVTAKLSGSVTKLSASVFEGCDSLKNVTLGVGLTGIPDYTFRNCAALESILVPYYVKTIGKQVFADDIKLTAITLPGALTSIGSGCFSYPERMTIYGIAGTYAETYAKDNSITFVDKSVNATDVKLSYESVSVNKGSTFKLAATISPDDFTDDITWKSDDNTIATVTDGTVKGIKPGDTKITLTVGNVSAVCAVKVVQPATSMMISRSTAAVETGDTVQLSATVYPADAADKNVMWSSDSPTIATVSDKGTVTGISAGTAKITAQCQNFTAVCTVTVTAAGGSSISKNQPTADDAVSGNGVEIYIPTGTNLATDAAIDTIPEQVYTGKPITPEPVVKLANGTVLVKGVHYKVSYSRNTNAGSGARLVVTGIGNVKGRLSGSFTIKNNDLTSTGSIGIFVDDGIYNKGKAVRPRVYLYLDGKKLSAGNYTVKYDDNTQITDSAVAVITGKGANLSGSRTVYFRIISDRTKLASRFAVNRISSQLYSGEQIKPEITFRTQNLTAGTDYKVTYINNINVGQATAVIRGLGDYAGIKLVTFNIGRNSVNGAQVSLREGSECSYSGYALTPKIYVTLNGTRLLGSDYKVSYSRNVNPGTANIIVKGNGNYSGRVSGTFSITAYDWNSISANIADQKYTGKKLKPVPEFKAADGNGINLKNGKAYTAVYGKKSTDAGSTVDVSIIGKGPYVGQKQKKISFKIVN